MGRSKQQLTAFVLVVIFILSFSSCSKKDDMPEEILPDLTSEEKGIDTYIMPYLGIVMIDQFEDGILPEADDLVAFYADSNKIKEEGTVDAEKLEAFVTDVFNVDSKYLRYSNYYNAQDDEYSVNESRLEKLLNVDIIDVELLENGNRITFEYREINSDDSGTVNSYTYSLDIEYAEDGFRFIQGKNIKTQYNIELE